MVHSDQSTCYFNHFFLDIFLDIFPDIFRDISPTFLGYMTCTQTLPNFDLIASKFIHTSLPVVSRFARLSQSSMHCTAALLLDQISKSLQTPWHTDASGLTHLARPG